MGPKNAKAPVEFVSTELTPFPPDEFLVSTFPSTYPLPGIWALFLSVVGMFGIGSLGGYGHGAVRVLIVSGPFARGG